MTTSATSFTVLSASGGGYGVKLMDALAKGVQRKIGDVWKYLLTAPSATLSVTASIAIPDSPTDSPSNESCTENHLERFNRSNPNHQEGGPRSA